MYLGKKPATLIVSIIVLVASISPTAEAKSVYVISDTIDSNLAAYKIDGSSLVHQTNYICQSHPGGGVGAVGLAIDESEYGQFLFVTFEGSNVIELVNAKSMQYVDTVTATGASNLAGIVADQTKQKVYVVDRGKKYLYVYDWYPNIPELVQDGNRIELEGLVNSSIGGAWGTAIDEENERLYVTSNTETIRYYDANDPNWKKLGQFDVSHSAVGIAIDVNNGYVYTGSSQMAPTSTLLSQYDLSAGSENTPVDVCSPVLGIAVDQDSSLVYITTYGVSFDYYYSNPPRDQLMIYDSNLLKQPWESGDIGNPAGVTVGTTAQYKPSLLVLTKDDNDVSCVVPGDYITYTISYDANGHSVNDVNIIDYLPDELDFNSASGPNMTYDPDSNTVTWEIGTLSPGDENSVTLTVRVNQLAEPNGTLTNFCKIETESLYTFAVVDTNVCCWSLDVIYVDVNATGRNLGTSWQHAYTDLQDALETARTCGCNEIWVAEGTYKPTTDPYDYDANFGLVDGVGLYGGFTDNETSRTQRNWITNETILSGDINGDGEGNLEDDVEYVVSATSVGQTTIIDGFTIMRSYYAGIKINAGSPTIEHNKITKNRSKGIDCDNSSPNITNCTIADNGADGLNYSNSDVMVTNCTIEDNSGNGIYNSSSLSAVIANNIIRRNQNNGITCSNISSGETKIKNNWIYNNGTDGSEGGIYINWVLNPAIIRNNTIVNNTDYGINSVYEEDTNISNCIIWDNNDGQLYCYSPPFNNVTYSCIQGDPVYGGNGNINTDPCFVDDPNDPNNYHLSSDSPCIDAGDPNFTPDPNETDIDGEPRIIDGRVDMGADEYNRIPQDPHKFYIKNNSGETVAWFGNLGNLVLKGTLTENTTPDANDNIDEFRFKGSGEDDVAIIDTTNGNMYIVGLLYDEGDRWKNPKTPDDDFIIKNSDGYVVAYISDSGNVYLRGGLYPNSDP